MNRKPVVSIVFAVTTGLTLAACSQDGPRADTPTSDGKNAAKAEHPGTASGRLASPPSPPLDLPEPPAPSPMSRGKDLREAPPDLLESAASQLYHQKRYPEAIQILYYAVQAGAHGQYNLACDYALDGKTDAAFYWLQKAALDEGVDAEWAEQDSDLDILRKDGRWSKDCFVPQSLQQLLGKLRPPDDHAGGAQGLSTGNADRCRGGNARPRGRTGQVCVRGDVPGTCRQAERGVRRRERYLTAWQAIVRLVRRSRARCFPHPPGSFGAEGQAHACHRPPCHDGFLARSPDGLRGRVRKPIRVSRCSSSSHRARASM